MNRTEKILEIVKERNVLDVGCVDHNINRASQDEWLHKQVVDVAQSVLGIDIAKAEVEKAKSRGYNFICGNAEQLDKYVEEKFDVVLAGEFIEHIANPGLFLASAKEVLKPDGVLVLTTPNAFTFGNIFKILKYVFGAKVETNNVEHKAWYDVITLRQLLESQGYEILEMTTVRPDREHSFLNSLKYWLYGEANAKIFCVARKQS